MPEDLPKESCAPSSFSGSTPTWHKLRIQIGKLIQESQSHTVLDLGCGNGALTQILLDQGLRVVSADLTPESFEVPGKTCVGADLNGPLPFQDAVFDAIACVETIEHLENPHLLIREANRILQTQGRLFLTTPNTLSIRSRMSYLIRGYPNQFHYMIEIDPKTQRERPIAHINPIGYLELRYILSRWGFDVDVIRTSRYLKRRSPFYAFLRVLLNSKGKREARTNPNIVKVRQTLLSETILYGEHLIIGASKVQDYRATESFVFSWPKSP